MKMKMICKSALLKITMAAALVLLPQLVFAYDGTISGDKIENCSRKDFVDEIDDEDFIKELAQDIAKELGSNLQKFFKIDDDNADEEDDTLLKDLTTYIGKNYDVDDGDVFSHFVIRGYDENYADGWCILSHWTEEDGWLHAIYYFETEKPLAPEK